MLRLTQNTTITYTVCCTKSHLKKRYFHIVFTVPQELNLICLLNSNLFYKTLFESAWNVLKQFGYTKYGVESCTICVY